MSPERARAIDHLADSQAKVGGALSDLSTAIEYLITLAKWFIVTGVVVGGLVAVGIGILVWSNVNSSRARTRLLTETAAIARTANEVHSAVTPGQPIYEQGQAQQGAVLVVLFAELDCRSRTALRGLPPVPASQRCTTVHPDLAPPP